jgi:hypothetical protein
VYQFQKNLKRIKEIIKMRRLVYNYQLMPKKKSFKNKYLNKIKETKGPTSANSGLGKMEKNEAQNG